MDDEVLDFIVNSVWDFYERQDQTRDKIKALEAQRRDAENAVNNLMRAIEAGMPLTDMTKNRLSELDAQITAITTALAQTQLESGFQLQKEHIQFFLEEFRKLDYTDRKCQQRLIDVFVNSIYVTDDELVLNFNFGGDKATLRFPQFKAAQDAGVFDCRAFASTFNPGAAGGSTDPAAACFRCFGDNCFQKVINTSFSWGWQNRSRCDTMIAKSKMIEGMDYDYQQE